MHLVFTDMRLYSLGDTLAEWQSWKDGGTLSEEGHEHLYAEGHIRGALSHPRRIPIASQENTTWLWVDLSPGPAGTSGQILFNISEVDLAVVIAQ